jgi:hypothetical protein
VSYPDAPKGYAWRVNMAVCGSGHTMAVGEPELARIALCPSGHEAFVGDRFCGECGDPMEAEP